MCIDPHQTGCVGKGSDHLKLIKFWPPEPPGRGSGSGRKFLTPPYYSQHAVFASLLSDFSFVLDDNLFFMVGLIFCVTTCCVKRREVVCNR